MTPEQEVIRAGKSRDILDNEIFKDAVHQIEEALKYARLNSDAKDVSLREKLWAQEVALYSIQRNLRTVIETGELAEAEIRQKSIFEKAKEMFNV